MKSYDIVISKIITELDQEQADYQYTYRKLHGDIDKESKHIYELLFDLCRRIRSEIKAEERK
jgi:hypothetical protein